MAFDASKVARSTHLPHSTSPLPCGLSLILRWSAWIAGWIDVPFFMQKVQIRSRFSAEDSGVRVEVELPMEHLNGTEAARGSRSEPSGYKSLDLMGLVDASGHDFRLISIKHEMDEITLDECTSVRRLKGC